jgi:hypothetical protein
MNSPQPSPRPVSLFAKLLGVLGYLFVVALLILVITGAGVAIVRLIRAVI